MLLSIYRTTRKQAQSTISKTVNSRSLFSHWHLWLQQAFVLVCASHRWCRLVNTFNWFDCSSIIAQLNLMTGGHTATEEMIFCFPLFCFQCWSRDFWIKELERWNADIWLNRWLTRWMFAWLDSIACCFIQKQSEYKFSSCDSFLNSLDIKTFLLHLRSIANSNCNKAIKNTIINGNHEDILQTEMRYCYCYCYRAIWLLGHSNKSLGHSNKSLEELRLDAFCTRCGRVRMMTIIANCTNEHVCVRTFNIHVENRIRKVSVFVWFNVCWNNMYMGSPSSNKKQWKSYRMGVQNVCM